jgi:SAM-dependent methyltransferase
MRILDIGGGASMATGELRRRGAIAYAIDYRYRDVRDLKHSVDVYLTKPEFYQKKFSQDIPEEELKQATQELQRELPPGADPRLWSMAIQMAQDVIKDPRQRGAVEKVVKRDRESSQLYVRKQRQARDAFFGNLGRHSENYIGALAGELPFQDDTFDFAFSLQTISFFLIRDREVFMHSVNEALRVLKPGGELQLQPWPGNPMVPWPKINNENAGALVRDLRSRGIRYAVKPTTPMTSPVLRVVKP